MLNSVGRWIVTHTVALAGLALNVALIVVVGSDGGRSSFSARLRSLTVHGTFGWLSPVGRAGRVCDRTCPQEHLDQR